MESRLYDPRVDAIINRFAILETKMRSRPRAETFSRDLEALIAVRALWPSLLGLRGFWPMSSFARDHGGYNLYLTYGGGIWGIDGLAPYWWGDGSTDYLSHTDDPAFDITGTETTINASYRGMTLGGWFYPQRDTHAESLMTKWGLAGNRSYSIYINGAAAGDPVGFAITADGTNAANWTTTEFGFTADEWQFLVARYNDADTGEEMAVFRNDEKETDTTTLGSIYNSTAPFNIGSDNNGSNPYLGRASMCFLCAAALSDDLISMMYQASKGLYGVV